MFGHLARGLILVGLSVASFGHAEEEDLGPIGPPPVFAIVMQSDGQGFVEYRCITAMLVADPPAPPRTVMQETVARQDLADDGDGRGEAQKIRVLDLDGKRLKKADAARRLQPGTALVLSADGEALSKFYTRHLKPDTLVLVRPKAVGAIPAPFPPNKRGR